MAELTSMRKLKWAKKKKEIQEAALAKAKKTSEFIKQNGEAIAVAVPAGAVILKSVTRTIHGLSRNKAVKRDIRDRQTRFYDHKLGLYWHTRRPLTADELRYVQKQKAAGESYGDIFAKMKLLK